VAQVIRAIPETLVTMGAVVLEDRVDGESLQHRVVGILLILLGAMVVALGAARRQQEQPHLVGRMVAVFLFRVQRH
jgi:uncharacterized membrane protein YidH (DUF202 family)